METTNSRNIIKTRCIGTTIVGVGIVFSLAYGIIKIPKLGEENPNPIILDSEEYGFYSTHYLDNLKEQDENDFDKNFYNIYKNLKVVYNNKEYRGESMFIVQLQDGTSHLVNSDNNKMDFLTNEPLTSPKKKMVSFKESSIFFDLYQLGIIKEPTTTMTSSMVEIIAQWDGEKHDKTMDMAAQKMTSEEYKMKYGGR